MRFTGIRPLAYYAPSPVALHLYFHLHKPELIIGACARAGGPNMLHVLPNQGGSWRHVALAVQ